MRRPLFCTSVALLVLAIASDPVNAQETRDAPPDWSGYYTRASARDLAGTGFKKDFPGEELNKLIIPHLQPWAKARMKATDGVADDTGQVCLPDGIFRYPTDEDGRSEKGPVEDVPACRFVTDDGQRADEEAVLLHTITASSRLK